ncbi:hypothetical protein FQR65_LT19182 [Abscondita terminalis]|nr:hypothetical protein FQR65_LT19182 [Abscondita terminalis]
MNKDIILLRTTEVAAIASYKYIGRKDKNKVDKAAVEVFEVMLKDELNFKLKIINGEGELDKAPMLYSGQILGSGDKNTPIFDASIDPIEGTYPAAYNFGGSISVICISRENTMKKLPEMYMEKVFISKEFANKKILELYMEFKSRMDKNKHLHESVNREIAQKRKNDLTKTTIYATFEVLKKIDLKFFEEKIRQFDNKYGYEKPYLFEDKSKSILSEDIKFEIKRFIGELDELKVSEFELIDNEDTSRDKVIELRNDQFKEYRKVLIEADKNFENRMFKYKSNQKNNIKFNSDIKMDIVEQVRNNDMRDVYKMYYKKISIHITNNIYNNGSNCYNTSIYIEWSVLMGEKINIAVDGTAGSGKSTTMQIVADKIGYEMIDTGLMYRAFTKICVLNKINFESKNEILKEVESFEYKIENKQIFANGIDLTKNLMDVDVLENINKITVISEVRSKMVSLQKKLAKEKGKILVGRDITTVVLPDAELKIYLDTSIEARVKRRIEQNKTNNINLQDYDRIYSMIKARDESDKNREVGPLTIANDAIVIDNRGITLKDEPFAKEIKMQAEIAIQEADVVVFVINFKEGITPEDEIVAKILYRTKKPVILVVNKYDKKSEFDESFNFLSMGLGDPIMASSTHGIGVGDLLDRVVHVMPKFNDESKDEETKIAIIGKPNVGKSSLVNSLVGEERMIVSEIAGTTTDSVDTKIKVNSKNYTIIDTAGLRKKGRIYENLEKYSYIRSISSINKADIVVLMFDASVPITDHDTNIGGFAHEEKKPIILIGNKWDIVKDKDEKTILRKEEEVRSYFKYLSYAQILFISAKEKQRIAKIFDIVDLVKTNITKRIKTSLLNEIFNKAQLINPAPNHNGKGNKKMEFRKVKITIIGTGAYGTVLGNVLADNGHNVLMYGRDEKKVKDINENNLNSAYFNYYILNPSIKATTDFIGAIEEAEVIVLAVPTLAIEENLDKIIKFGKRPVRIISVAKGMDSNSNDVLSKTIIKKLKNILQRKATCIMSANEDLEEAKYIANLFTNEYFNVIPTTDLIGCEVAATLKNTVAIAGGILNGFNGADNAKASLITIGLNEMIKIAEKIGAKTETFFNFACLGDLVLTASSSKSRNFKLGLEIAEHNDADVVLKNYKSTVEGVQACKHRLYKRRKRYFSMTKKELFEKLSNEFNSSKSDAEKQVNFIFDEITKCLVNGEEVNISGFGKFVTAERAAREGVNPATGAKIQIAATTVAKFKVAKQLKEAVAK